MTLRAEGYSKCGAFVGPMALLLILSPVCLTKEIKSNCSEKSSYFPFNRLHRCLDEANSSHCFIHSPNRKTSHPTSQQRKAAMCCWDRGCCMFPCPASTRLSKIQCLTLLMTLLKIEASETNSLESVWWCQKAELVFLSSWCKTYQRTLGGSEYIVLTWMGTLCSMENNLSLSIHPVFVLSA